MKRCTKCGVEQPLEHFYRQAECKDGLRGDCKSCFAARAKARYATTRERDIERVKAWRRDNPEKYAAIRQRQREDGSRARSNRKGYLKRVYGMTPEEYASMLEAQGGGCAVCGKPPRPDISLHIDHDHESGRRRGLLCFSCNQVLGSVGDDASRLIALASYLNSYEPRLPEIDARLAALKASVGR